MVIWLRNPQAEGPEAGLGIGVADDVLRAGDLATLVDLDARYVAMRVQCDAALEAARAEAQAIVDEAHAQAGELVARAEEEYASAARRGYDDGFTQALSEWHERALRAQEQALTLGRQRRDRLAELVALAVQQIVATADPVALFARAAATIEHIVADGSPVQVRVHPSDLAAASAAFDDVARAWREAGRAVRLLVGADSALEPSACVIETDLGALDATLSLQLAAMRGALARAVRSVPDEDFADDPAADDESGEACADDACEAGMNENSKHADEGGEWEVATLAA